MNAERLKQVEEILNAALEIPPAKRESFFNEFCGEDVELRREVESLLAFEKTSDNFLDTPPESLAAEMFFEQENKTSLINRQIGRYKIKKLLGAGGMGEIFLADDTELERLVALKVLPVEVANDSERIGRFVQEAKAVSALNHPNIITIHEIGKTNDTHFIATEYIEGETLHSRLSSSSSNSSEQMNLKSVLDIAIQTAGALDAAHRAGIVHRDIKPENIMIRPDGFVKILDFGIAKLIEKKPETLDSEAKTRAQFNTKAGVILGTARYMSPEQARGKNVDARTDVWSLGVCLYEMLSGTQPFQGETVSDTIASILTKEPLPLDDGVPSQLQHIVHKTLRKDAGERYKSAKDLLLDLEDAKEELKFQNKLERSSTHRREEAKTQILSAATTDAAHTPSSAEYIASEIKRHKSASFLALLVLLSAIGGLGYWFFASRLSNASQIDSIAVLPFQNVGGNADTEYLSDGIAESLINSLTELQQLRVIARATAFRYKNKEVDPQEVGNALNVRAVLTGRVRQTGDKLNIQVDLVDAAAGAQLWGAEYERNVSDVVNIKQAIAREVTEKLRLKLSGEQQQQLVKRDTTNAEAYQFYLRGRYFWNKRTAENLKKAIAEFQQAIDRDPGYALGYVGLADSYLLLEEYAGVPAGETLPKAKAAVDRALQIDDTIAEAHASLGYIFMQMWLWREAEQEFRRAIALNPNYPTAHHWFSNYFRVRRQFDDAFREIKRAQELDPLSPVLGTNLAFVHTLKNNPDAAIEQCKKVIELDPKFPLAYANMGRAYLKQRRYEEAVEEFQKAIELTGRASFHLAHLGYTYAVMGRREDALAILGELEERYNRRQAFGLLIASVYVGLGDKDQAFAWLEKDFQQHSGSELPSIAFRLDFDELRSDARYADLLRRMGLEP